MLSNESAELKKVFVGENKAVQLFERRYGFQIHSPLADIIHF